MSFRLPLWVYWTLAALGVAGATWFTVVFDFDTVEAGQAGRLLFTVWGGPVTLILAAGMVTYLKRRHG